MMTRMFNELKEELKEKMQKQFNELTFSLVPGPLLLLASVALKYLL
jgi:hypothetical protein